MANHFCDNCGARLDGFSEYVYGRFCSLACRAENEEIIAKESPKTGDDIIANLVGRLAVLERKNHRLESELVGVKRDIETWAQEVEKVRRTADTVEANLDDIASRQRDHVRRLSALDDKIEMCIDDIAFLDERTAEDKPKKKGGCCACRTY